MNGFGIRLFFERFRRRISRPYEKPSRMASLSLAVQLNNSKLVPTLVSIASYNADMKVREQENKITMSWILRSIELHRHRGSRDFMDATRVKKRECRKWERERERERLSTIDSSTYNKVVSTFAK